MTDDELNTPIPVNQSAGPPAADARSFPSVAEMPSPAVEDGDSAVAGKGQPRTRRKPKIMQFGKGSDATGEPKPVVLDVPEAEEQPNPAGTRRRRSKKITGDQAVELLSVPFRGAATVTGAPMWLLESGECDWFKDELAEVLQDLSKQSGGALGQYFPYIVAGTGVAFISLTRLYGYMQLLKMAKMLEQRQTGPAMSHPSDVSADHANADNGFDQAQSERIIAAMMGQMGQ